MEVLKKIKEHFMTKHIIKETKSKIEGIREEKGDKNISDFSHFTEKLVSTVERATTEGEESHVEISLHLPQTRRRSSVPDLLAQRKQEHLKQLKKKSDGTRSRSRAQTMSCNSYFLKDQTNHSVFMDDPRLTENAKDLSPEQMRALELDIFKPLDFYEIFFNRILAKDNGEALEEEESFSTVYHLS